MGKGWERQLHTLARGCLFEFHLLKSCAASEECIGVQHNNYQQGVSAAPNLQRHISLKQTEAHRIDTWAHWSWMPTQSGLRRMSG